MDALAREVEVTNTSLRVELTDGRSVSVPLAPFPRLVRASDSERKDYRLIGGGRLIRWDAIDEDIEVAHLVR